MASAIPGEGRMDAWWRKGDAFAEWLQSLRKIPWVQRIFRNPIPTKMTQTWSEGTLPRADRTRQTKTKRAAGNQNMEVKTLW